MSSHRPVLIFLCFFYLLSACSERLVEIPPAGDAAVDAPAPSLDAAPDSSVMPLADAAIDAPLDATPDAAPPEACTGGETQFFVLNLIDVTEEEPPGVAPGFDLDDRVSDGSDRESCGHEDFISPSGEEGIDNQLVTLIPLVEALGSIDLSAAIAGSVNSGGLLLLLQLDHVDSMTNDDCINVSVLNGLLPAGTSVPELNSSGMLSAGQTFDVDADSYDSMMEPLIQVAGASISDGVVEAGPVDLTLPLPLGASGTLPITARNARIRFNIGPGRISMGLLGGGVLVSELAGAVMGLDIMLPIGDVSTTLQGYADLNRTAGVCSAVSLAFELEGVNAVMGMVREF